MDAVNRSRAAAEAARQGHWEGESFLRELFLGRFRFDMLEHLVLDAPERPEYARFHAALTELLKSSVDPDAIDRSGQIPREVIRGLAAIGAFGMKIPVRYGGLGFTHSEYMRAMELVGGHDANVAALLSAHQAVGVPQPVLLFGTDAQKMKWLPRCARGAISAFALTEPSVGSDPARLETIAAPIADGSSFVLHGDKLWCTNGAIAELIVVVARNPQNHRISAFVVETSTPGVVVEHRCQFMGLRALENASIRFEGARIPRENLIGREGDGLRIALTALDTGRLSLPAATAGVAKYCTELVRKWSRVRVQWGAPVGEHEAVAAMNASIVSSTFAMESVARVTGALADAEHTDVRLEAAAAKEWNTSQLWQVLDDTVQVRGGRGYETHDSLAARGEAAPSVERALRDARVNRIFEGTNEIMHLFLAREGLDEHLEVAGDLVRPGVTLTELLDELPGVLRHYARWYPPLWVSWRGLFGYWRYGPLGRHLRFAERATRRLARDLFHAMVTYGADLEKKQRFLFRAVDVALEIFAASCTVLNAQRAFDLHLPHARSAVALADHVGRRMRERVEERLHHMWHNDDAEAYRLARGLLAGEHQWLEKGAIGTGYRAEDLRPPTMGEIFAAQARPVSRQSGGRAA